MPLDIHAYFLPVENAIEVGSKTKDFAKAYEKLEEALENIQDVLMLVYANEFAPLEVANRDLTEMHRQDKIIIDQLRKALKHATEPAPIPSAGAATNSAG